MTDKRLKSFADRLDNLEEERKGIVGDIKDVFTEVKSAGYNPKALRKVLAERRKKTDAELEADMELYRAALAEPGATYRSVAAKTGASKSKLQRLVPRERNGTEPPHDADGIIIESNREAANSSDDAGHRSEPSAPADTGIPVSANAGPPLGQSATSLDSQGEQSGTHSGGDAQDESYGESVSAVGATAIFRASDSPTAPLRPHDAETMASPEPETSSEGALSHSRASCGDHSRTDTCGEARGEARPNPDGLDIPSFLRRTSARAEA